MLSSFDRTERLENYAILSRNQTSQLQAMAVTVEDDSDDNIPDEWKQSSVDSPTTPSVAKNVAGHGKNKLG